MKGIEKSTELSGYLGIQRRPKLPDIGQKSSNIELGEKALKKELNEDSFAKQSMLELLSDNLVGKLSLPENYKTIDKIAGEEGAAEELAEKIWRYSEKLGNKIIIPENSAKDIIKNVSETFFIYLEKIKAKGPNKDYEKIIKDGFANLERYIDLLSGYGNFEKSELNNKLGFLGGTVGEKEAIALRADKSKFLDRCGEILKSLELKKEVDKI